MFYGLILIFVFFIIIMFIYKKSDKRFIESMNKNKKEEIYEKPNNKDERLIQLLTVELARQTARVYWKNKNRYKRVRRDKRKKVLSYV